jgi:hypothetical protein
MKMRVFRLRQCWYNRRVKRGNRNYELSSIAVPLSLSLSLSTPAAFLKRIQRVEERRTTLSHVWDSGIGIGVAMPNFSYGFAS